MCYLVEAFGYPDERAFVFFFNSVLKKTNGRIANEIYRKKHTHTYIYMVYIFDM